MGTKFRVEGIVPLFQGDLNWVLLKSISKPFSICALTRVPCRPIPEAGRFYPQSIYQRKLPHPACSQAEGSGSTARKGGHREARGSASQAGAGNPADARFAREQL